jgi:hypothetical protein
MFDSVYVISTPNAFAHSFETGRVKVHQLPSNVGDTRFYGHAGPFEHHFYVCTVPVGTTERAGVFRWEVNVDDVIALMSLFFGKRITNHGLLWLPHSWMLPDLQGVRPTSYHTLPIFSGQHFKPLVRDCDWRLLGAIELLLETLASAGSESTPIVLAARAYAESLRILPTDREIAFFRLIQAVESAASSLELHDDEKFSHDSELLRHFEWLEKAPDARGRELAAFLRRRLYQVKRCVWLWLERHVDGQFYADEPGGLRADGLQQAISAAYDLRSRYVHTGERFGEWIDPAPGRCGSQETIPAGFAELHENKNIRRLLARCPSYVGLERLVRYALNRELEEYVRRTSGVAGT